MMTEPQLCQILIQGSAGLLPARRMYPVGLNGRYKAVLIGFTCADSTQNHDNRLITIKSDSIRKAYGASNALLFCNKAEHAQDMGGNYPFYLDSTGGGIDLEVTSSIAYTNGNNDRFDFIILSFAVEPFE
jgi:hypothetical protein